MADSPVWAVEPEAWLYYKVYSIAGSIYSSIKTDIRNLHVFVFIPIQSSLPERDSLGDFFLKTPIASNISVHLLSILPIFSASIGAFFYLYSYKKHSSSQNEMKYMLMLVIL